jgi:hypothetical protein
MRKWKEVLEAGQREADALRCPKTKQVMEYVGSFAEMPALYRCVKDADHDNEDCIFFEEKLPDAEK